ncbi:MAG: L-threonylcarbamoyladenylate synthase [Thermoanaerobaculia bacterium]
MAPAPVTVVPVSAPAGRLREVLVPLLDRGGVVAVPTESSYGLAVDPRSPEGIARVFRLKGRETAKALPLVAADLDQVLDAIDPDAPEAVRLRRLAPRIWPGPVSLVLPAAPALPAAAPDGTVAVRIPADAGLRRLLAELGRPLTASSANRAGEPPILDPEGAVALLAPLADGAGAVVDGGRLPGGPPSTLVRIHGREVEVLREGAVGAGEVRRLLA